MLTVKHRETLGWYVDADGTRVTEYTPYRVKAQYDCGLLICQYGRRELEWAKIVKEAHREEDRTKAWIKLLERKYHARHIRADKVTFYNKAQAISMAMQK